jgi:hypothetical protein
MPYINWKALPWAVREHLRERVRTRDISESDLRKLLAWERSDPIVPEGRWVKDFGSFKLVGKGKVPLTILRPDQAATSERVE